MLLERLWGPLESTRVLFWNSWSVFGGSWMGLGDSLGASFGAPGVSLGGSLRGLLESLLRRTFIFKKLRFRIGGSSILETRPSKEREARAVRNHEDIRR